MHIIRVARAIAYASLPRKVISIGRMTVSTDGKTMTLQVTDVLHGTTSHFTAQKQ